MTSFDDLAGPVAPTFSQARHAAHYASQLLAAAGTTYLDADPEFHYSSTTWAGGSLYGAQLTEQGLI